MEGQSTPRVDGMIYAHTIDQAVALLDTVPVVRLIKPGSGYFEGDPYEPTECCPLWHLAVSWGLVWEEQYDGEGSVPDEIIAGDVTALLGLPAIALDKIMAAYDDAPDPAAGLAAVRKILVNAARLTQ